MLAEAIVEPTDKYAWPTQRPEGKEDIDCKKQGDEEMLMYMRAGGLQRTGLTSYPFMPNRV